MEAVVDFFKTFSPTKYGFGALQSTILVASVFIIRLLIDWLTKKEYMSAKTAKYIKSFADKALLIFAGVLIIIFLLRFILNKDYLLMIIFGGILVIVKIGVLFGWYEKFLGNEEVKKPEDKGIHPNA
jgi:uncharacterized membrane protein